MGERRLLRALGMSLVALLAVGGGLGCVDEREPLTNRPPGCKVGTPCGGPSGGMGSSGSGGGDGGPGANEVTGNLLRLADEGFLHTSPFAGSATIRAPRVSGGFVEAAFENGSFNLSDVQVGDSVPFQIIDAVPGAPEILSTLNYRKVTGSSDNMTLVAANEEVMTSLAQCLNITMDPASAHAILRLVKNDFAFQGGVVTDDGSVGTVAYQDVDPAAPCAYTLGGSATGPNGFAVLFNIPVPDNGRLSLEVSDGVDPFSGLLDVAKGTVTYTDLGL
jgi:hypothetical protein